REGIEHGNAQRAETLLKHLLQCLRMWPGRPATITPLTISKIPYGNAAYTRQLARLRQLNQRILNAMWAAPNFFEQEDRPVQIEFPGRPHRQHEIGETAAYKPPARGPRRQRAYKRIIRIAR